MVRMRIQNDVQFQAVNAVISAALRSRTITVYSDLKQSLGPGFKMSVPLQY